MTGQQAIVLRKACVTVAARLAGRDPPLSGFCGAMAIMIQRMFGGVIVTAKVKGMPHYWNRMECGKEWDLTSCQFGGDGFGPLKKGRKTKTPDLVDFRYLWFGCEVLEELGGSFNGMTTGLTTDTPAPAGAGEK